MQKCLHVVINMLNFIKEKIFKVQKNTYLYNEIESNSKK